MTLRPDGSIDQIIMRNWPDENYINDGDRSNPKRRRRLPDGRPCTAAGTADILYSIENPSGTDTVLTPGKFISSRAAPPDSCDILGNIDLGLFVPPTQSTSTDTTDLDDDEDTESDGSTTGNVMFALAFSSDDETGYSPDTSSD